MKTKTAKKPTAPMKGTKTATAVAPVMTERERELAAKYTHQTTIVPGSWRASGGREGWGIKATVEIDCVVCSERRVVATSDLQWPHTNRCHQHAADARKNARKTKAVKKPSNPPTPSRTGDPTK